MWNELLQLIDAWQGKRILVVGDVCRDEWIDCVPRENPEADAPCFTLRDSTRFDFGMAKLVANLIDSLGGQATLLTRKEIAFKTRLMVNGTQVARFDRDPVPLVFPPESENLCRLVYAMIVDGVDAVILSDYGKGTCSTAVCFHAICAASFKNTPVLVDPSRGTDWSKYAGATWIKANAVEAREAGEVRPAVFDQVIVTDGDRGIRWPGGQVDATPRQAVDPCGCGDACAAVLGLCLAIRAPIGLACRLANHAGGLAVEQRGTPTITADMLRDDVRSRTQRSALA